jgi:hypothetical protein
MRSEQIHRALAQGHSRFQICQLVSKGIKVTHKSGTRFEDSIGSMLSTLGSPRDLPIHRTDLSDAGATPSATRF